MKIVFICASFFPSLGGVETHVLEISKELIRRGHSVTVITEYKPRVWHLNATSDNKANKLKSIEESSYFKHSKLDQIDIFYFKFGQPSFFKKFRIWFLLLKNLNLFRQADVIHAHDVFIWYLPLRFLLIQKKIFTTFHGYEGKFPPENKATFIRHMSNRLSYGSINVGAFIEKWYGTKADYTTYGGVNKIKNQDVEIKNTENKERLKILLVGRLEKDMSIQIYIDTLKKLKEKNISFIFTAVGDGSFRKQLEQYGRVTGFVPVERFLKKADIVFSSSYLLMLESLQFKKRIFSAYSNPLKHDYLRMSPFADFVTISNDAFVLSKKITQKGNTSVLEKGFKWANTQTWIALVDTYITLWNKK